MGDESGGSSELSEGKCDICGNSLKRNKIKCVNGKCNTIVHSKCFDSAIKLFFGTSFNKTNWQCKKCCAAVGNLNKIDATSNCDKNKCSYKCDAELLHNEIDILKRENVLINKCMVNLEYTNKLQKDKLELLERKTVSTFFTNNTVAMNYSSAVKTVNIKDKQESAILLIKTTDQNTNVMNEVKNRLRVEF